MWIIIQYILSNLINISLPEIELRFEIKRYCDKFIRLSNV